jgi:hypothetical protein
MLDLLSALKNLLALKIIQLERIYEYFFFVQDLTVRFMEVHFFPGSEKCVRFNQVSALHCPLYGGDSM